jgi:hypothetical protein
MNAGNSINNNARYDNAMLYMQQKKNDEKTITLKHKITRRTAKGMKTYHQAKRNILNLDRDLDLNLVFFTSQIKITIEIKNVLYRSIPRLDLSSRPSRYFAFLATRLAKIMLVKHNE